jgi:hypothetical protein
MEDDDAQKGFRFDSTICPTTISKKMNRHRSKKLLQMDPSIPVEKQIITFAFAEREHEVRRLMPFAKDFSYDSFDPSSRHLQDFHTGTMLHAVSAANWVWAMDYLLSHDLHFDLKRKSDSCTPLHVACAHGAHRVVRFVRFGACYFCMVDK